MANEASLVMPIAILFGYLPDGVEATTDERNTAPLQCAGSHGEDVYEGMLSASNADGTVRGPRGARSPVDASNSKYAAPFDP